MYLCGKHVFHCESHTHTYAYTYIHTHRPTFFIANLLQALRYLWVQYVYLICMYIRIYLCVKTCFSLRIHLLQALRYLWAVSVLYYVCVCVCARARICMLSVMFVCVRIYVCKACYWFTSKCFFCACVSVCLLFCMHVFVSGWLIYIQAVSYLPQAYYIHTYIHTWTYYIYTCPKHSFARGW